MAERRMDRGGIYPLKGGGHVYVKYLLQGALGFDSLAVCSDGRIRWAKGSDVGKIPGGTFDLMNIKWPEPYKQSQLQLL